jgi:hypothetical protein
MKKTGMIKTCVLLVLVLFMSGVAFAQGSDDPADNMQIVKEKIKADKKLLVASNMNLTEKEAKAFWPLYESYQKKLAALNERALKNIGTYADNADSMTDSLAKKVVQEYLSIENDRQKLRESFLPKFTKALPYKKVMRYYQIENKVLAIVNFEVAKMIPLVQ